MRVLSVALLAVAVGVLGTMRAWGDDVKGVTTPSLVPMVTKFEAGKGGFALDKDVVLVAGVESKPVAEYLAGVLNAAVGGKLGIDDETKTVAMRTHVIMFHLSPEEKALGAEGYRLMVHAERVDVVAATTAGEFYACQTLRQMLPMSGKMEIAGCTIEDVPAYPWRGALLDSCRHFFPKETVERFIDLLAYHKMNVLQWHLTDDQGWRIEIKKYPKLTSISAWRLDGATGSGTTQPAPNADGSPAQYGGFYTQDDIREVVAYAKVRHVTIVPEIEMPGHALAALAAYPGLSNTGGPFEVGTHWGVYKDVYDPSNEETFTFLQNVLDEVCELFPGDFVHVGGDECPKDRWKASDSCQALMKKLGLKNEDELQSYFIKRMEKYLETKHKRLIGWNEILQGGLPEGAAVTSWQGMAGGLTAAKSGHDVVMCPQSNCYFDHLAAAPMNSTDTNFLYAGTVPLNKVYAFEPTPSDLTPDQATHILGAQGNLWSERIPTQDRLDFMEFPRMAALAEVLWTGQGRGDFAHFMPRMEMQLKRLNAMGVKYFDDPIVHGQLIGSWATGDKLPKSVVEKEYPVNVVAAGNYVVRFEYTEGKNRLDVPYVALLENGKEIARETHAGFAGGNSKLNGYALNVKEVTPGASYTIKAGLQAKAGVDTKGDIFFVKGEPATQPAGSQAR